MTNRIGNDRSEYRGARFFRCALQVNSHGYAETFRGQGHGLNETEYVRQLIAKAVEFDVRVLAVTDHGHVSCIGAIQEEAAKYDIVVFPGFELTSQEGIHVLCIYPAETTAPQLERFLGSFGVHEAEPNSEPCSKTFEQILDDVRDQGGVTIAAHVTSESGGLLRVLKGQPRANAWKLPRLLAVQIPGSPDDLPEELAPIIRNRNPDYRRDPAAAPNLAIAVVNAKDVTKPADLEDPAATCWIKMTDRTIDGLRQAFLDPDSRIRLAGGPEPEPHVELLELKWLGGFLDGSAIHFGGNLNVLIGGRGTGKSTVIESLRYVLDLEPLGDEAKKAHEGVIRYVLESGTKVVCRLRSHQGTAREYIVERTVPNPPIVRDADGNVLTLAPRDVVPRVELFGQHEIAELTRQRDKLTLLLDRFVKREPGFAQRKRDLCRQLEKSRQRIVQATKDKEHVAEQLAALPGMEEMLQRFQAAGLEERLKDRTLLIREERVFDVVDERLKPLDELSEQFARNHSLDRAFLTESALADLPARATLQPLDAALAKFETRVVAAASQLADALREVREDVAKVRETWNERRRQVQNEYEKTLRDLQKSKIDGEEFIRLRKQIEQLRPMRERLAVYDNQLRELEQERRNLLAEWEDIKAGEARDLQAAAKRISKRLDGRVRVQVTAMGNREPLELLLRERVGGNLKQAIEMLSSMPSLSLTGLANACRSGADTLVSKFRLSAAAAGRLSAAGSDVFMQLEELDLPATTQLELNVAAEAVSPDWKTLDQLSKGQKATAILLLLLLENDAPLIVDQPEDDLDNRFITDGIVPRMREEKHRRQFIFSTHNANIPVLGDAELIVGLSALGEAGEGHARILPEQVGSIDSPRVCALVEEILEGGKAAFELRRRKYNF